jgi:hypothetical protein
MIASALRSCHAPAGRKWQLTVLKAEDPARTRRPFGKEIAPGDGICLNDYFKCPFEVTATQDNVDQAHAELGDRKRKSKM